MNAKNKPNVSKQNLPSPAGEFSKQWGFEIEADLLVQALTHRSFAHENGNLAHNERLEFLGDAVLQIIVTEYLYRAYPDLSEGILAKMRAATVSQTPLAQVARQLNVGAYILLGIGEDNGGGRDKDSILSDTMEALIGATYLSSGMETTRQLVERHLRVFLRQAQQRAAVVDWKTTVQQMAARIYGGTIVYQVQGFGPDHARHFKAQAVLGDRLLGTGEGTSKKQAENRAACASVEILKLQDGQSLKPDSLETVDDATQDSQV